jgi:hypothetical protein
LKIFDKDESLTISFMVGGGREVIEPQTATKVQFYFVRVDKKIRSESFDLASLPKYQCKFIVTIKDFDGNVQKDETYRPCMEFKRTLEDAKHSSGPE